MQGWAAEVADPFNSSVCGERCPQGWILVGLTHVAASVAAQTSVGCFAGGEV